MMTRNLYRLLLTLRHTLLFEARDFSSYFYGYDLRRMIPIEPLYCEITGYGMSLNSFLYNVLRSEEFHSTVEKLSNFLTSALSKTPSSVVPYGFYLGENKWSTLAYSFDNGVVAKGFFDAYRFLSRKEVLGHGLRICNWLVTHMQNDDGSFRAAYDYNRRVFMDFSEWFGDRGSLHGKLAIPLLLAWRLSGEDRFRESVEKLLSWLLRLQLDSGAFRAREDADYVFHHAHCYALEGLLYAWHVLGDDRYLDAVVRGAEWLIRVQHRSGGVLEAYPSRRLVRRLAVDATAQAVRIWLLLYKALGGEVWLEHAERGLGFLERNMFKRGEAHGGLPAYVYLIGPIGYRARRIHTWSIMFAIQAFLYYQLLDRLSLNDMIEYLF